MAKVSGPYFSVSGAGQVGNDFQVRCNRYGHHLYRPRPRSRQNQRPATPRQAAQRSTYAAALAEWRALTDDRRDGWNASAARAAAQVSGWNLFFQAFMLSPSLIDGGTAGDGGTDQQYIDGGASDADTMDQISGGFA